MATKTNKKKTKKRETLTPKVAYQLVVCLDCKIRLVLRSEESTRCGLCKSVNITREVWV